MNRFFVLFFAVASCGCGIFPHLPDPVFPSGSCHLDSWRKNHPEYSKLLLVSGDSLDHSIGPVRTLGNIHRPAGFVPGHQAWVVLAVVLDTSGMLLFAEPVATRIVPGRDSTRLRPGFERAAIELLHLNLPYEPATRSGRAVNVFSCLPVRFSED